MKQQKMNLISRRALRDCRVDFFCRSREYSTGKNHYPDFSLVDVFALGDLSTRAKDETLWVLCGLKQSGRETMAVDLFFLILFPKMFCLASGHFATNLVFLKLDRGVAQLGSALGSGPTLLVITGKEG